ncbi:hypothetical protein DFH29DRAFT_882767 [Suillus ampliporus]|nr:hypothetical protein DFH29DRAFT_882767 [Suillus ampliporus]
MVSKSSKKISKGKYRQISSPVTRVDATSKQATNRPFGTTVAVNHHKHTLPALPSVKHLIAKPQGAAGKREIRIIANSTLEQKKTFRQQPPSLINEVVLEILAHSDPKVQIKFPFFQQFADGWPIHNVLKRMLLNQKHDAKYRLNDSWNKDCHDKEGNEPDEQDDSDVQPESEEEVDRAPAPAKKTAKKTTNAKKTAIITDDLDVQPQSKEEVDCAPAPAKKTAQKTTHKKTDDDMKTKALPKAPVTNPKLLQQRSLLVKRALLLQPPSPLVQRTLQAQQQKSLQRAIRQNVEISSDDEFKELISVEVQRTRVEESENIPAKLKRKHQMIVESEDEPDDTEKQPTPLSGQTNGNVDISDRAIGLFKCPRDGCFENLPTNISSSLMELLDAREVHLTADGPYSVSVSRKELEICLEITKCRQSEVLLQRALTFGWPTLIDFKLIPPHVKVLEGEIQRLLTSSDVKENCYVFNLFSGNLIAEKKFGTNRKQAMDSFSKHKSFKMTAPQLLLDVAQPGYYGPKGYAVIQACIQHLVNPTTTSTIAFQPLTLQQYTHFILIPFIALRLIMEDLKSEDEMDTYEYMTGSGDVGDMLQGLDDQGRDHDIDNIIMAVACKRPVADQPITKVVMLLLHLLLLSGLEHLQSCHVLIRFILNAITWIHGLVTVTTSNHIRTFLFLLPNSNTMNSAHVGTSHSSMHDYWLIRSSIIDQLYCAPVISPGYTAGIH